MELGPYPHFCYIHKVTATLYWRELSGGKVEAKSVLQQKWSNFSFAKHHFYINTTDILIGDEVALEYPHQYQSNLLNKCSRMQSLKDQKVGYGNSFSLPPLVWLVHSLISKGMEDRFCLHYFHYLCYFCLYICQIWNQQCFFISLYFSYGLVPTKARHVYRVGVGPEILNSKNNKVQTSKSYEWRESREKLLVHSLYCCWGGSL